MDLCDFEVSLVYRVSSGQGGLHKLSPRNKSHIHTYTPKYTSLTIFLYMVIYIYIYTHIVFKVHIFT